MSGEICLFLLKGKDLSEIRFEFEFLLAFSSHKFLSMKEKFIFKKMQYFYTIIYFQNIQSNKWFKK